MAFAELLEEAGGLGLYQILQMIALLIPIFLVTALNLVENFSGAIPDHHCRVPGLGAHSDPAGFPGNLTPEALLTVSIPLGPDQEPEKCRRFLQPQWQLLSPNASAANASRLDTEPCLDGWTYDLSVFSSTIVAEWDLVCDSRALKPMSQSLYMGGILLGAAVCGQVSDRFGRKLVLSWCYLLMALSSTCAAFAPNFSLYCALRFLSAFAVASIMMNTSSLLMEWATTKARAKVMTANALSFSFGLVLLAGTAYAIRAWRLLQLTLSMPFFISFIYSWCLSESARWLLITGRAERGLQALQRVARINGSADPGTRLSAQALSSAMQEELAMAKCRYTIMDLFRTPTLRKRVFCMTLVWFAFGFTYYGLALDLQALGSSLFLLQVLFGTVDFPAKFLALWAMNRVGRRWTQIASLFLAGLSVLANVFVSQEMQPLRLSLAVLGIGSMGAAFSCHAVYSSELYPTVLRMTAISLGQISARLGSMLGPLVRMTGQFFPALPLITYGAVPIIAGLGVLFLPETKNLPLPDTIQDVESGGQREEGARGVDELEKTTGKTTRF
ncbi:solute carrier family 22 member 12 [Tachyglossus aculeatus]|uniref:solute carrier family 22 member 12 n=1 Tax=Tachyglossus aculeatus TaxID=9261 RepID=UPI0018F4F433|nr:solute carrier family 22 member 12 [Tachyglossus aculeatus]